MSIQLISTEGSEADVAFSPELNVRKESIFGQIAVTVEAEIPLFLLPRFYESFASDGIAIVADSVGQKLFQSEHPRINELNENALAAYNALMREHDDPLSMQAVLPAASLVTIFISCTLHDYLNFLEIHEAGHVLMRPYAEEINAILCREVPTIMSVFNQRGSI